MPSDSIIYSGTTLINVLARRLRDTANLGYARADLLTILNNCHRAINARLALITDTTILTLGDTAIYDPTTAGGGAVEGRVIGVTFSDTSAASYELVRVPFNALVHQHPRWLRLHATRPEVFATLGRNLLAIVPICESLGPSTNTIIRFVRQLPDMADTGTLLTASNAIPDPHMPILIDLAEAVSLYKGREFQLMQAPLMRAAKALGLEEAIQKARRLGDETRK